MSTYDISNSIADSHATMRLTGPINTKLHEPVSQFYNLVRGLVDEATISPEGRAAADGASEALKGEK
ncbi:MAG: hypothetical protein ABIE84_05005 [bacterium]